MTVAEALNAIRSMQVQAPVKVVPIANRLGLEVYRMHGWPDDLSGMIKKDKEYGGGSGFAIFVNADHPNVRRRFTIAHEIAHFVLHRDHIGTELLDDALYRSGLSGPMEVAANKLAADILMPWHLLNEYLSNGVDSVAELAKIFDVSKSSMSIRLGVPYEGTKGGVFVGVDRVGEVAHG